MNSIMSTMMNNVRLPLMAGALVVACAGSALAMSPGALTVDQASDQGLDQSLVQDVRLICHANGRCYEVHRRFYEEPGYYRSYRDYDYDGGPYYGGPSVGFSFGFGGGHHRW
jgi:hypothetical protein